jgi:hypothetical protein
MDLEKIKSIEQIYLILVFLTPGLITLFVRSLLVAGRRPKTIEHAVEYIIISTLYFAVFLPLVEIVLATKEPAWFRVTLWVALLAVLPALIGLILGAGTQKGWWRLILSKASLSVVSPYPTGWDWVFGRLRAPVFLLVTLEDDSRVAGLFGIDSIAASKPEERDIFIDEIYEFEEGRQWTPRTPKQGILIPFRSIKYIEIWDPAGQPRIQNGQ